MFSRPLRIAFRTTCLQRLGTYQTRIQAVRVRAFASAPSDAENTLEKLNFEDVDPLLRQLIKNRKAMLALGEFRQRMKEQGINFYPDRPPSRMDLFGLMINPAFRVELRKLREDLADAGMSLDLEDGMELLKALKRQDTNSE